mgnify:CR=1 FL=1
MSSKEPKVQAIMNIGDGEEIAGMWVTPHIEETGIYKLLAKKRKDGKYEWAHFIQRDNGIKEGVFTGVADSKEQLLLVHSLMNQQLSKIFNEHIVLKQADYDMYTVDGVKRDNSVN